MKALGLLALLLAFPASAVAGGVKLVPEIDASTAASAIALVSGGLLILRSRRKK